MNSLDISFNTESTGVSTKDWLNILSVFSKHLLVKKVILYGSRAKGNYKAYSDIDLTVEGAIDLMQLQVIENELYDLNLPYKIDISQYHVIKNTSLLDHIHRVGIIVYEK